MRVSQLHKALLIFVIFLFSATVYAQNNYIKINGIGISGNSQTRESVITRELTFKTGDTISYSSIDDIIARSRENLLNTSLFNFVTITKNTIDDRTDISIVVEERWYTWPSLILKYEDRNFSAWLKAKDLSKSRYGISVDRFNCFGRKETLNLSFSFGFANQLIISYKNIALDRNRRHFIGADIEFSNEDEVIFKTHFNEPLIYKSRFHTVFQRKKYTLNYLYRPYIYYTHSFYLNYFEYSLQDTIIKLNPDYFGNNISTQKCFTFDYVFTRDTRDSKAYPLKGLFFETLVRQTVSTPFSKYSFYSTSILPSFYKYVQLNNRLYYAGGINFKFSFSSRYSYFYSKSLGYKYNLHGFEYNTIEGQQFIVVKNLIKFTLLKTRVTRLKFIPINKFNKIPYAVYLNIFNDAGYVNNKYKTPENSYSNRIIYSVGAGLDLVTYYDRTLRADYSINCFGKSGIYLHLTAPFN
jgi:outer membrane protein assembly factor BamA